MVGAFRSHLSFHLTYSATPWLLISLEPPSADRHPPPPPCPSVFIVCFFSPAEIQGCPVSLLSNPSRLGEAFSPCQHLELAMAEDTCPTDYTMEGPGTPPSVRTLPFSAYYVAAPDSLLLYQDHFNSKSPLSITLTPLLACTLSTGWLCFILHRNLQLSVKNTPTIPLLVQRVNPIVNTPLLMREITSPLTKCKVRQLVAPDISEPLFRRHWSLALRLDTSVVFIFCGKCHREHKSIAEDVSTLHCFVLVVAWW